jgi:hypothetical protein
MGGGFRFPPVFFIESFNFSEKVIRKLYGLPNVYCKISTYTNEVALYIINNVASVVRILLEKKRSKWKIILLKC